VLARYPGVCALAAELGELAQLSSMSVEAKLREYAEHHDPGIGAHFKEVPPYLRDLLNGVVGNYTSGRNPGTLPRLVMSLLRSNLELAFIDLNYDDYVEMALEGFDPKMVFRAIDDYAGSGRQAIVVKAHGSVH
jgi:hypothetical protein